MTDSRFHRPQRVPGTAFDNLPASDNPALRIRVAHETAAALLARVRANPEPETVQRVVEYTDTNGIEVLADLWADALPRTLPGALWRIYLLRALINENADDLSRAYRIGQSSIITIDPVVAGVADMAGPAEILTLADTILRGAFTGDFAVSLDRAAAFARITALGITMFADDFDALEVDLRPLPRNRVELAPGVAGLPPGQAGLPHQPEESRQLTQQAARFADLGQDLSAAAALWRSGKLE